MKRSKSPVVTELEYIEPLCPVFESGSTTIISTRTNNVDIAIITWVLF